MYKTLNLSSLFCFVKIVFKKILTNLKKCITMGQWIKIKKIFSYIKDRVEF